MKANQKGIDQLNQWISLMNNFPIPKQSSIRIILSDLIDKDKLIITKKAPDTIPYTHPYILGKNENDNVSIGIVGNELMKVIKEKFKEYIFHEFENGDIEMDYQVIVAWQEYDAANKHT